MTVMDSTEAQLRFGSALSDTTDSAHPTHPLNPSFGRGAGSGASSSAPLTSRDRLVTTRGGDDTHRTTGGGGSVISQTVLIDTRRRARMSNGEHW